MRGWPWVPPFIVGEGVDGFRLARDAVVRLEPVAAYEHGLRGLFLIDDGRGQS